MPKRQKLQKGKKMNIRRLQKMHLHFLPPLKHGEKVKKVDLEEWGFLNASTLARFLTPHDHGSDSKDGDSNDYEWRSSLYQLSAIKHVSLGRQAGGGGAGFCLDMMSAPEFKKIQNLSYCCLQNSMQTTMRILLGSICVTFFVKNTSWDVDAHTNRTRDVLHFFQLAKWEARRIKARCDRLFASQWPAQKRSNLQWW